MQDFDDGVKKIVQHEPHLLSEILYDQIEIRSGEFGELLKLGAIYVNDERQTKDRFIWQESKIRVHTKPRRYNCNYDWSSKIIFENDFCLVLNKPSGVPSHAMVDNLFENALTQTSLARKFPLYVTHRLDTLTSGLIVYAKKQSFAKIFNLQLQDRSVEKKYVALVEGTQKFPNRLTHFMDPAPGPVKKISTEAVPGWLKCELEILEQKQFSNHICWVKLNLLTGRTHQIRAQMSAIGSPVLGDQLYGSKQNFLVNAIALRSYQIEFNCADKRMTFAIAEDFNLSHHNA